MLPNNTPVTDSEHLERTHAGWNTPEAEIRSLLQRTLGSEPEPNRIRGWNHLGRTLGAIHKVLADGFYRRNPDGNWDFADWRIYSEDVLVCRAKDAGDLLDAGFTSSDVDLNVTGVIDFGLYQGEHPIFDLAVMAMGGHGAHLRHIRDGYQAPIDDRFDLRLQLQLVPLRMGYLAHCLKEPDHPAISGHIHGLKDTLAWLRAHADIG
jgi:Ser/Thr protein kinase RdoA (MazF antagonist)